MPEAISQSAGSTFKPFVTSTSNRLCMPEPAVQRKDCSPEAVPTTTEPAPLTAGARVGLPPGGVTRPVGADPAGAAGIAARQVAQADHARAGGPAKGLAAACANNNRAVGADAGSGAVRGARQVAQTDHAGAGGPAKGLVLGGGGLAG